LTIAELRPSVSAEANRHVFGRFFEVGITVSTVSISDTGFWLPVAAGPGNMAESAAHKN
jgi:hypothetical protein